jgi:outer membrane protein OmpA-like peptidoglycan-associated protein
MKRAFALVLIAFSATGAAAQKYKAEDPIPSGATAKVLLIKGTVLEIRGLASAVSGKSESLAAALKDLGATQVGMEVHIALSSDVLFDFDKSTLRAEATPALEKVAVVINSYKNPAVTVEGHSDSVGADAYNQALSDRRARAVQDWLAAHKVTAPISTRGWGESKPVAPNTNPDGSDNPANRQKNRRVEIVVKTG